MTKRAFGDLESQILHLFQKGNRMTVKEVQSLLGSEDKYTTVMTVTNRLVEKKRLGRERTGHSFEYWILHPESESASFLARLRKTAFGMKTSALISQLIETEKNISDEELQEIEKMIQKAREKKV